MRTSTVVFLVIFLCLFSSAERRSSIARAFQKVKAEIQDATCGGHERCHAHGAGVCHHHGATAAVHRQEAAEESDDLRALRLELREIEQRDEAAKRALRTIDRSQRALDDRIRGLETEIRRTPRLREMFENSLGLLSRQRLELAREREEIVRLQERMKGEGIRIQAEIDLTRVRGERREVESFLTRERRSGDSPVDRLLDEDGAAVH